MTTLFRSQTVFDGFEGAPGYATMYSLDIATFQASLITMWTAIAPAMPNGLTIRVKQTGDQIEDTTGELIGAWDNVTTEVDIPAGGSVDYAAPVGGLLNWTTGVILDGRRVKGHTFVVPLGATAFGTTGGLLSTFQTLLADQAAIFRASQSASLVIWHRPRAARPGPHPPAAAARLGGHALVTGSSASAKAAVLKSRRDN